MRHLLGNPNNLSSIKTITQNAKPKDEKQSVPPESITQGGGRR
jgi:hypothetical protein